MLLNKWYSHRESNPDQRFRKPPFYPLNYRSGLIFMRLSYYVNVQIYLFFSECEKKSPFFHFITRLTSSMVRSNGPVCSSFSVHMAAAKRPDSS